jgi:hypothetical protein
MSLRRRQQPEAQIQRAVFQHLRGRGAPLRREAPRLIPTMLHPVSDQNAYCGPTAMAAVTGRDITEIERVIREAVPRYSDPERHIVGINNECLLQTMQRLGWRVAEKWEDPAYGREAGNWGWQGRKHQFTFADFLETHAKGGPFIVTAGHHYLAVGAGKVVDTSHRKGVKAETYVQRWTPNRVHWVHRAPRARVSEWFRFELASPLAILADRINTEHEAAIAAIRKGAEHAIAAGKLLIEAKAQVEHGRWGQWLKDNFRATSRTAQLYMWLAEHDPDAKRVSDLPLREAVKHLRHEDRLGGNHLVPRPPYLRDDHEPEPEPEAELPTYQRRVRDRDGSLITREEQEAKGAERRTPAREHAERVAYKLIHLDIELAREVRDILNGGAAGNGGDLLNGLVSGIEIEEGRANPTVLSESWQHKRALKKLKKVSGNDVEIQRLRKWAHDGFPASGPAWHSGREASPATHERELNANVDDGIPDFLRRSPS